MNPFFVAYAKTHGRTAEQQLEHDAEQYPGGRMAGFICWISDQKAQFRKAHPEAFIGSGIHDRMAWGRWVCRAPTGGQR